MVERQARLVLEVADKILGRGDLLPHHRQEDAPLLAVLQDEPVRIGPNLRDKMSLIAKVHWPRRAQNRDTDNGRRKILLDQGFEAPVSKGGAMGVLRHIRDEVIGGPDRSHTTLQSAVRMHADKGSAHRAQGVG